MPEKPEAYPASSAEGKIPDKRQGVFRDDAGFLV